MHGLGLGALMLKHLAVDAAEHGVRELEADILAENRPMIRVLRDLGMVVKERFEDGSLHVTVAAEPTPRLLAAIDARDHEAGQASLARLWAR